MDCHHILELDGEPPHEESEPRPFVCRVCGEGPVVLMCEPGRRDPYPLDPFREAVGAVVQRCFELEVWLGLTAARLLPARQEAVQSMPVGQQIRAMREAAPEALGAQDASLLEDLLQDAAEVLDLRHHLIHGVWLPNEGRTAVWAQKAGRRGRPFSERRFDRLSLIALVQRTDLLCGRFQMANTEPGGISFPDDVSEHH